MSTFRTCRMPNIGELSLYDVVGTAGVAADVSHMDCKPKVFAWDRLHVYAEHSSPHACIKRDGILQNLLD